MGAGGRPSTPTELKVLSGTYRPDRAPKNEPKPPAPEGLPAAPPYFDAVAKKEWNRLGPTLLWLKMLTVADLVAFETYCLTYSRLIAATKSLKKAKGMFYEYTNKANAKNYVVRPEVSVIQKESLLIKVLCAEFGLTPSSRGRMEAPEIIPPGGAPPTKTEKKDTFEGFMNGPKKRDLSG